MVGGQIPPVPPAPGAPSAPSGIGSGLPSGEEAKGFLAMLFDFKFSTFVTTKLLRFIYILVVILNTLGALLLLIAGLAQGGAAAVFSLLFVPIGWIVYTAVSRVMLEILYVVFQAFARIANEGRTT